VELRCQAENKGTEDLPEPGSAAFSCWPVPAAALLHVSEEELPLLFWKEEA